MDFLVESPLPEGSLWIPRLFPQQQNQTATDKVKDSVGSLGGGETL